MGLLSDIEGALQVVGGIALIATGTPLGILGGALLETSFASQQGWLGGGAKNFFSSGVGQGLTLAVGLASGAMAIEDATSAVAPVTTAGGADASAAAAGMNTGVGVGGDMGVGTGGVPNALAANAANDASGTAQAFTLQNFTGANSFAQGEMGAQAGAGLLAAPPGDILSANALTGTTGAQSATLANQSGGIFDPAATPAQGTNAAQAAVNPAGGSTNVTTNANPNTAVNPTATPGGAPPAAAGGQGWLSNAASKVGNALSTPAGMIMGGQALSGFAQGKAQENIMQRQLAAAQWGNTQWEDPTQVAAMQAAAAAPINVPSGYLARAANARAIMNASTSQTTPLSGAPVPSTAPPAPSLPTPGTQPPGMAAGNSAGPVPLYMTGATPRGGTI